MIHCRPINFVEAPHGGWVLDDDETIVAAYGQTRHALPRDRLLWAARSGRHRTLWSIWDRGRFTGELHGNEQQALGRVLQLLAARAPMDA